MIYTVIADTEDFRILSEKLKKRDCHDLWQPLTLIPENVFEYIKNTKNDEVRLERLAAYSTLFFALCELYGKRGLTLCRPEYGKPYLDGNEIYISLSHTDGAVAVALSDEYELGVDIQSEIDEHRAARLEKRFFDNINIKEKNIPVNLFRLNITGDAAAFEAIKAEPREDDFTARWAYCESLLKCDGSGFSGLEKISEIQEKTKTSIKKININKKQFTLSIAIKSAII